MNISPTFSKLSSTSQLPLTTAASGIGPKFVRSAKDHAPAVAASGVPAIDPNAPPEEQRFFNKALDMATAPEGNQNLYRLALLLQNEGSDASAYEQFSFRQKPASIQTRGPRIVVNVGSDDDASAGQLTVVNAHIEQKKGVMQDPHIQIAAMRPAIAALCLGMAQRKNMPYAAQALREVQQYVKRFE
jgi:hypothetical protein